jgi:hypothetical protein
MSWNGLVQRQCFRIVLERVYIRTSAGTPATLTEVVVFRDRSQELSSKSFPFHLSFYHSAINNHELTTYRVLSSVKSTEENTTNLENLYWGTTMFSFAYEILVFYCKSTSQESRQELFLQRSMLIKSCYWKLVYQLFTFLVKIFPFRPLLHNVYQLFTFLVKIFLFRQLLHNVYQLFTFP